MIRILAVPVFLSVLSSSVGAQPLTQVYEDGHIVSALRGVWFAKGYGEILDIAPDGMRLYHVAGQTCLRDPRPLEEIAAVFPMWSAVGTRNMLVTGSPVGTQYAFQRIVALPKSCRRDEMLTPAVRFQFMVDTFSALYPSFERRGVNWKAALAEVHTAVPAIDDDEALWRASTQLFGYLNDPHSALTGSIGGEDKRFEAGEAPTLMRVSHLPSSTKDMPAQKAWLDAYREGIMTGLLKGNGHHVANKRIFWGRVGDVGYLNIVTMGAFGDDDQAALAVVLDEAITAFSGAKAVIVDVSNNRGGYDDISRAIAERFATRRALAFTKQPAATPDAAPQAFFLEVRPELVRYTGPVYLVTSDITVSAGEVFTLYMRSQPQVTQVGATTRGALSDQLEKPFGDGWTFSLSSEIYRDPAGFWPEALGIKPDVDLPIFKGTDLATSHQHALQTLLDDIADDDPILAVSKGSRGSR